MYIQQIEQNQWKKVQSIYDISYYDCRNIWKVLTDPSSGKLYYLNTQTNTTQWEVPKELQSTITNTLY